MINFVKCASLHVNYLPYIKVCNYITEDDLSVGRNMYAFDGIIRLHRISVVRQHVHTVIYFFTYLLFWVYKFSMNGVKVCLKHISNIPLKFRLRNDVVKMYFNEMS
jgi:hypothetical protein